MTKTKLVRFSDQELSVSDIEPDEESFGFVTKRTFELLEHDEPLLEKHFKILQRTASEHCETWNENIKEVAGPMFEFVEPIKDNANRCVDCVVDVIRRAKLQEMLIGRPKPLSMVGGPAPYVDPDDKKEQQISLFPVESDEHVMKWVGHDFASSPVSEIEEVPQSSIGRQNPGIMKINGNDLDPLKSMVQDVLELEQLNQREDPEPKDSYSDITLPPCDHGPHSPSGKRPESPIKVFSSQDLEGDAVDNMECHTLPYDLGRPRNNSQNLISIDDYHYETRDDDPVQEVLRDNSIAHNREGLSHEEGEERDQPPVVFFAEDDREADALDSSFVDFRPIERFSHHSHLPLSTSLLFSMKSRNRAIENLLAELPTRYSFGTSVDDLSKASSVVSSTSSKNESVLSQENSIDSTKVFDTERFSQEKKQGSNIQDKGFKFISFRRNLSNIFDQHISTEHTKESYRSIVSPS